jgi:hypothetical protein
MSLGVYARFSLYGKTDAGPKTWQWQSQAPGGRVWRGRDGGMRRRAGAHPLETFGRE